MRKIEEEVAMSKQAAKDLEKAMIKAAEHDVKDTQSMRMAAVASIKAAGLHDTLKQSAADLEKAVQEYQKLVKIKIEADVDFEMGALAQLESKESQQSLKNQQMIQEAVAERNTAKQNLVSALNEVERASNRLMTFAEQQSEQRIHADHE